MQCGIELAARETGQGNGQIVVLFIETLYNSPESEELQGTFVPPYDDFRNPEEEPQMSRIILILLAALLCLTGCSAEEKMTYRRISQEEGKRKLIGVC